eukprot:2764395-Lingulodinium_polyedra.AAC.1
MPVATPSQIRESLMQFAASTSAIDGLHPRGMAYLSEPGLRCMALIFVIVELWGDFPSAVAWLLVRLLRKPAGRSRRPIGLYPGIFRAWGRLRRAVMAAWERGPGASRHFTCTAGRRTGDAVWRNAVRTGHDAREHK